jgi:hypothetical protein
MATFDLPIAQAMECTHFAGIIALCNGRGPIVSITYDPIGNVMR